jgi:hypothetical protein
LLQCLHKLAVNRSFLVNRFQKIDRLSNRRLWISRAVKGSLSAWRPCFQKGSTSTAQVSGRKGHVCAPAFRIDHTDFFAASLAPEGGLIAEKCKNPSSQKSRFQKSKNAKLKVLKTFVASFSARPIAKLFAARSCSCSQDQEQDFHFFGPCPPFPMCELHT